MKSFEIIASFAILPAIVLAGVRSSIRIAAPGLDPEEDLAGVWSGVVNLVVVKSSES